MAIDIDWVFLAEEFEVWPDGAVRSIRNIIRPGYGLGERTVPLRLKPRFWISLHGQPGSELKFVVAMGESGDPKLLETSPMVTTIPATGMAEILVPCGEPQFRDVGVFVFELRLNNEPVYTVKAPLARSVH